MEIMAGPKPKAMDRTEERLINFRTQGAEIQGAESMVGSETEGVYMRSGAVMPISSNVRRNTIWADSTNFNRAAVMASSSS